MNCSTSTAERPRASVWTWTVGGPNSGAHPPRVTQPDDADDGQHRGDRQHQKPELQTRSHYPRIIAATLRITPTFRYGYSVPTGACKAVPNPLVEGVRSFGRYWLSDSRLRSEPMGWLCARYDLRHTGDRSARSFLVG